MKRKLFTAIVPLSMLLIGAAAHAEKPDEQAPGHQNMLRRHHSEAAAGHQGRLKDKLNLTEEQDKQVRGIFKEAREKHACKNVVGMAAKQQCREARRADVDKQVAGVLNKEQKAKFAALRQEHQERRANFRKNRMEQAAKQNAVK